MTRWQTLTVIFIVYSISWVLLRSLSHSSCVQMPCRRQESHWQTVHQCYVPWEIPLEHQTGPAWGGIPHWYGGNRVKCLGWGYLSEVLCVRTIDRVCLAAAPWHHRHCINAHALPGITLLFVWPKLVKGTIKLQAVTLQLWRQAVQALKCNYFKQLTDGFVTDTVNVGAIEFCKRYNNVHQRRNSTV